MRLLLASLLTVFLTFGVACFVVEDTGWSFIFIGLLGLIALSFSLYQVLLFKNDLDGACVFLESPLKERKKHKDAINFKATWMSHLCEKHSLGDGSPNLLLKPLASTLDTEDAYELMPPLARVIVDRGPVFFTSLGILFTFYGLISGLDGLDLNGTSKQAGQSMDVLISGVRVAFGSSLVGITTSLAVLFATRFWNANLNRSVGSFRRAAQGYVGDTPRELMESLVKSGKGQTGQLAELIDVNRDQSSKLGSLAADLASALESSLSEPLRQLSSTLERDSREGLEAHKQALDSMMDGFLDRFDGQLGGQLDRLGEVLQNTLTWHERTQASFEAAATELQKAAEFERETLARRVELVEAQAAIDQRRAATSRELNEALGGAARDMSSLSTSLEANEQRWVEISSTLDDSVRSLREGLQQLDTQRQQAQQMVEVLREGAQQWRDELTLNAERYRELSRDLREGLHEGLGLTFESFDTHSAEVVDRLNGSYLKMSESLTALERHSAMLARALAAERARGGTQQQPGVPMMPRDQK
jgi:hypothetical protein